MGIVVYSLLGIISIVLGCVSFSLGAELWVGWILFGLAFVCIGVVFYKLDKKFAFISKLLCKRGEKIAQGKYEMKPLDLVSMMIRAYEERQTMGSGYIIQKAIDNITFSYKTLLKNWKFIARGSNRLGEDEVEQILFDSFESLIITLINIDEKLDTDYDAYCAFCERTSHTPRSKEEVRALMDDLFENHAEKAVEKSKLFVDVVRSCMPHRKYFDLVQGFCYLALSDNIVNEGEFEIISIVLFTKGVDILPKDWGDFKQQYK